MKNTKTITLTEIQISFIKLTLINSKFEDGGEFKKDMTEIFENLHIDILNEMHPNKIPVSISKLN